MKVGSKKEENNRVANVHDVTAYILAKQGRMSTWKLQKLVYYSQAWSLVWDNTPLFQEPIEAWPNGPVVRALHEHHEGKFTVTKWSWGKRSHLSKAQKETIDSVLESYGQISGRQLTHMTHNETPWREARFGLRTTDEGSQEIKLSDMQLYYTTLETDEDAPLVSELVWETDKKHSTKLILS